MTRAEYGSLDAFARAGRAAIGPGPTALLTIEDDTELQSSLDHLAARGFGAIVAFAPSDIRVPSLSARPSARDAVRVTHVTMDTRRPEALPEAVNTALALAPPGTWLHTCYNAEYLMFPFCERRSIGEMLAFHAEERRSAMLTFVVDLYAPDLAAAPSGVCRGTAHLDRIGYYALARSDPSGTPRDRQLDFHGGLRRRFEEHVSPRRGRIDRIGLFRARPNLRLRPDHTFSDEEYNTYACPWHNSLTAAICSFRAAKALRANPISQDEIDSFLWQGSVRFEWNSRQLLDLGLMEPGQWF